MNSNEQNSKHNAKILQKKTIAITTMENMNFKK